MEKVEESEDIVDEEEEEDEDILEEEGESGEAAKSGVSSANAAPTSKVVTLSMLLNANILNPGQAALSVEYMGQKFIGDLLSDGKIRSIETDSTFASPSAWANHCKRIINPDKKSGTGWASIKYNGVKLEVFKNKFLKKKTEDTNKENETTEDEASKKQQVAKPPATMYNMPVNLNPPVRIPVKHHHLGNRTPLHNLNTLVETTPWSSMGKIQPFLVTIATSASLVMDFHCHLTTSEVTGYLAGYWDVNAHTVAITHALPCRCRLMDKELAPLIETELKKTMEEKKLTLVGWYHSHPHTSATPTIRDVDRQLEYELALKGNNDASYIPCIGFICSPYNKENISSESSIMSYWVMPPPEHKPNEYPRPMLMSYSVSQDPFMSQDSLNELKRCVDFYKNDPDCIIFRDIYRGETTYLEKLKMSLTSKFPRDQDTTMLWNYISELACPGSTGQMTPPPSEAKEKPPQPVKKLPPVPTPEVTIKPILTSTSSSSSSSPSIPSANYNFAVPSTSKVPTSSQQSFPPNMFLNTDLATALLASGKFPSAASLMGLSNLFAQTNPMMFKGHSRAGNSSRSHSPTPKKHKTDRNFVVPDVRNYVSKSQN
nr:PREDICTED: MPN domain-containing protein-like [Bemisia tabaci]